MAYSVENGQVVLRMSFDDYERVLMALGTAMGAAMMGRGTLGEKTLTLLLNRLNEGNPDYMPYEVKP